MARTNIEIIAKRGPKVLEILATLLGRTQYARPQNHANMLKPNARAAAVIIYRNIETLLKVFCFISIA